MTLKIGDIVTVTSGELEGITGELQGFVIEDSKPCALLDAFCNGLETVPIEYL